MKKIVYIAAAALAIAACTKDEQVEKAPDGYKIIDLTKECGLKMLDRNVGAATPTEIGNFYQYGKNTPVAANDDTQVNENYDANWNAQSEGYADWKVAANTPCPEGWSIPNDEQATAIGDALYAIGACDMDPDITKEDFDAAEAVHSKMSLVKTGLFDATHTTGKKYSDGEFFWTCYEFTNNDGAACVGTYQNSWAPIYSKLPTSALKLDSALPVRCVKASK